MACRIGSQERLSSQLCNTKRSVIATLLVCVLMGDEFAAKKNVAIKSSNTLAKAIKNVDSGEEK